MIKIVKKKEGLGRSTYDIAQVTPEELIAGVVAAVGDSWTIDEAADFLLAEIVRQTVVEDIERPVNRYMPREFEAETILGFAGVDISESLATDVSLVLEERGLIERLSPNSIPPPIKVILTSTGLQRGMVLIGRFADSGIPASDRIVTLNHNDPALMEIRTSLDALRRQIIQGNDLGDMTGAEKEAAVAEVSQLDQMLQEPAIRVSAAVGRAQATLRWIADKAGGALIGATALAILQMIISYLGIF